ncbi:MAG: UPF0149 family protein [Candidatus Tectomicrobia bacterium]|nr:UPF0149 family protein [Candidatus Tectomicrobia bacterium]
MSGIPWNDLGYTDRDVYEVGEDVERLVAMLDALDGDAMTVASVDGYLTALALFRERVPVSEWMAQVWSKGTGFESIQKAELESALIRHCNRIARTLSSETENYGPLLQENQSTGELGWDEWILGFEYAARLRPAAWARIEACTEPDVAAAVEMLEILFGAVTGEVRVQDEQLAAIGPLVPILICGIVWDLNERDRPRGASKAERLDPAVPGTVGASSEPDPKSGCGLTRPYHGFSGIH